MVLLSAGKCGRLVAWKAVCGAARLFFGGLEGLTGGDEGRVSGEIGGCGSVWRAIECRADRKTDQTPGTGGRESRRYPSPRNIDFSLAFAGPSVILRQC